MDGILIIYKEKGFTSHDVVAKLRGIIGQRKIGHTGTLDPDAVGVLPVCLGKATTLCDLLTDKDKEYEAVIRLGVVTDTLDSSGTVLKQERCECSSSEIQKVIMSFVGDIDQVPPMYSAIKVNGKKLYELARKGECIERAPRRVTIHSIDIINIDIENQKVVIKTKVSKGTYIRSLCDDIGRKLGCGACMESLIRTRSGVFDIQESLTLNQVSDLVKSDMINKSVLATEDVFSMSCKIVKPAYDKKVRNGNEIYEDMIEPYDRIVSDKAFIHTGENDISVYLSDGTFAAIYRKNCDDTEDKKYHIYKMFLKGNV